MSIYPTAGWLADYLEYTKGHEAPELFHFWVGVTILSGVLRRNVWFDKAYYKVYPTHWTLLVAPTGGARKGAAINVGLDLLRQIEGINLIADKITPEGFIAVLSRPKLDDKLVKVESQAFVCTKELAVFLGRQKYNEGFVPILTDLIDSPDTWAYKTKHGESIPLRNVAVTLLGASTPDWLVEAIPVNAFGGGFMSRIIFVVHGRTDRNIPLPEITDASIRQKLVQQLGLCAARTGPFELTPAARQWYIEWYSRNRERVVDDARLSGYYERKPDHLLRLAMVLAIADNRSGGLTLTDKDLMYSNVHLEELEKTMAEAFVGVDSTIAGKHQARILLQVKRAGGKIKHTALLRLNLKYLTARSFREHMVSLIDSGLVAETLDHNGHYYELSIEERRELSGAKPS